MQNDECRMMNDSSSKFERGVAGVERSEPPATRVSRMANLELLNDELRIWIHPL